MLTDSRIIPVNNFSYIPDGTQKAASKPEDTKQTFDQIFNAAMDVIKETNQYQLDADQAQRDFATGKDDNILTVMIAQEKAYSALNFTVQVTNKIIESYREIMRMQI